ncbi:MAG: glutathione peroxidase [Bacteroidales bacterium]|jgi:glutathione peroxidase|nr:glutathione peroxidase [Bacteroidales bacterium]MDD2570073.1 glutathione peroxidase [Bacteroidales bacterium]MDD2812812.1 glutathione peroxidase [Bacteroidales bacterium]MDD3384856.1 glutathione peroxidase [Bacteroidales bacterium]MDD3811487.1 glutathione peroxidase [Bacteroidales bacterium]
MFRISIVLVALLLNLPAVSQENQRGFYDFTVKAIDGSDFSFAQLKGKKVIVVNTASKCGLTPQYEALQELYDQYGGDKMVIIGFPANNFLRQEPGTNEEILSFCSENYGVTFPMMSKVSVKGKDIAPIYKWLTTKELNGVLDAPIQWNFQKFLIDEDGNLVKSIPPKVSPLDEEITNWLN